VREETRRKLKEAVRYQLEGATVRESCKKAEVASYVGALKEKHEKVRGMLVASDFDEKA